MPRRSAAETRSRAGVILLVVVALLTLFALVGLSFVLVAEAQGEAARLGRETQVTAQPDVNPETLLSFFLTQLLYDVKDEGQGLDSSLRGHSLARSLFGLNDDPGAQNDRPYGGTGRLHGDSPFAEARYADSPEFARDDYNLIHYVAFRSSTSALTDGFLRDPERLGFRKTLRPEDRGPFIGGFNAPYTYSDLNSMFLAALRADGTVLLPSYHRPWTGFGSLDPKNPNWTDIQPWFKHLVLRPRPAEHLGFPPPEDPGGDVKNLVGSPGTLLKDGSYANNDSIWLDLGFPVRTSPDGRRYKPLFAPLVLDLDNRININVHGNARGRDDQDQPSHASNQGWGPWEVSLETVLPGRSNGIFEWPGLLLGSRLPALPGRYGGAPWTGNLGTPAKPGDKADWPALAPRGYAQVDFDACDEGANHGPSRRLRLPDGTRPLVAFPTFPEGFGNESEGERTDHPALFNPFNPGPGQRLFDASNLEALLRLGDTGAPGLTSELARLCPASLRERRSCGLVTTHSFDLTRVGASPWLYDLRDSAYRVIRPGESPRGPAVPFPALPQRNQPVPAESEFGADWRLAASLAFDRINVNRPLPPYPHLGSGRNPPFGPALVGPHEAFLTPAAQNQYFDALFERQRLAHDLYTRLLQVTGVARPADPTSPTDAELEVRRWLAQLAVNIVDYIDDDEISTPFNFYAEEDAYPAGRPPGTRPFPIGALADGDPELPRYWVFGVELPRIVLNEALVEYREPAEPTAGSSYDTNIWVELHNALPVTVAPGAQGQDGTPIPLQVSRNGGQTAGSAGAILPYQVVIADRLADRPREDNVLGKPAAVRARSTESDALALGGTLERMDGQPLSITPDIAPQGYFLLGPDRPLRDEHDALLAVRAGGTVPDATPILRLEGMHYQVTFNEAGTRTPDDRSQGVTVLLRRLANPHLPHDPQPTLGLSEDLQANPAYNPYVTIDTMEAVPLHEAGAGAPYASTGKRQPYAARRGAIAPQVSAGRPTQHTFGRQNDPVPDSGRYDWLVHLDRPLISPAELLHVAAYPPHRLTQEFRNGRLEHRAPWTDEECRLYRLFEFVETASRVAGFYEEPNHGARVPGKVNLNTVWDPEILLALCDPQPANGFTREDVLAVFEQLVKDRTGVLDVKQARPTGQDRPFLGMAMGHAPQCQQYPRGQGINDTFLRAVENGGADAPRLFQVPGAEHPYLQMELFTKIYNHLTTRSNVFAVWVTVGFFEVADETTRPVRLGAEIGRRENRHRRHRMFAVVDRSVIPPNPVASPRFDTRTDQAVLYFSLIQ